MYRNKRESRKEVDPYNYKKGVREMKKRRKNRSQ